MSISTRWGRALGFGGTALALLLVLAWIYAGSLGHELIFDDARLMDGTIKLGEAYQIQPAFRSLWVASFHWVHDWLGPEWRWQRLVNIGLHLANAVVLWCLTVRLLQRAARKNDAEHGSRLAWAAMAGVAIWAFNPVGAYAVVYLVQRSTLLATFFAICVMLAFIEAMRADDWPRRTAWLVVTAMCYGLVLMSKEHAAPIVAVLLPLYVYWVEPPRRTLIQVAAPMALLVVLCAGWLLGIKGWTVGAVAEDRVQDFLPELHALSADASERVYPLSVINQLWLFFRYGFLWMVPWPGWLSVDMRPPFPLTVFDFPQTLGIIGFVALIAFSGWALLRMLGAWRLLGLLLLIPATLYVTEMAYVRIQEPFVLYRSYLWSISFPALIGLGVWMILDEPKWALVGLVTVCSALSFGLLDRIESLRNSLIVWRDAATKIPVERRDDRKIGDWRPHLNLSLYLFQRKNYVDAYRHIQYAKDMGVPEVDYRVNAGAILAGGGRPDMAVQVMEPLMKHENIPFTAYFNLAAAYKFTGKPKQALDAFDKGLQDQRAPDQARADVLLDAGMVALSAKDWGRAEDYFRRHLAIRPGTPEAIAGVANAMYETGRPDVALQWLNDALQKNAVADLYHARAYIHLQKGDKERARIDNARSLELKPDHPAFLNMRRAIGGTP